MRDIDDEIIKQEIKGSVNKKKITDDKLLLKNIAKSNIIHLEETLLNSNLKKTFNF